MSDGALSRFQDLVRIPTISRMDESAIEWPHFLDFIAAVERLYPLLHRQLERELVDGHSLLYRWRGTSDVDPIVLMAHYDVVAATEDGWDHPPFGAELTGEGEAREIWGRGTLDDKGAMVAILEAIEGLLADGFTPARDIHLSFGHNEETSGAGAAAIVELLASRGVRPSLVLDEGGAIASDAFPGLTAPIAIVGVAEKGTTLIRMSVVQAGGHASTPPKLTATARLARAIVRITARPFPSRFNPTGIEMLRTVGRSATGILGFAFRHVSVTRPLLLPLFSRISDETSAMTRTTVAVTMLEAGLAANALAERATAIINARVAVGSSVDATVDHLRRAVRDDAVALEVIYPGEPSPVSPTSGPGWDLLRSTIATTYPGTVLTPYVQNGATDSRHFTRIASGVYRFTPFELPREHRDTLHAVNERLSVATWLRGIGFYSALIRGA